MEASYFGKRLKELRAQAGLTQEQLAGRSNFSQAGIADLEQGRRDPSWSTVLRLAHALGVTPNEFTQAPSARPEAKRGRPRKAIGKSAPLETKVETPAGKRTTLSSKP
jgi:transcriptional regulator with XRE-family HTH domain